MLHNVLCATPFAPIPGNEAMPLHSYMLHSMLWPANAGHMACTNNAIAYTPNDLTSCGVYS